MLAYWKVALVGLLVVSAPVKAEIVKAKTINEVYQHFDKSFSKIPASQTLGVFEVDMVLFTPGVASLQLPNVKNYSDILSKMLATLNTKQKDILNNLLASNSMPILIERQDPQIIKKIASKGTKLIALTNLLTGEVDNISNYEVWRYTSLKQLGIDFSPSFAHFDEINFTDLPAYCGRYPMFYRGILHANGEGRIEQSKPNILATFLEKVKFMPKKLIFVSDSLEESLAMEQYCKANHREINFLGIYYTAAENYPISPIDEEVFVKTWERFIEHAKLLAKKIKN